MMIKFKSEKWEKGMYWKWLVDEDDTPWRKYPDNKTVPTHDQTISWLTNTLKEPHANQN